MLSKTDGIHKDYCCRSLSLNLRQSAICLVQLEDLWDFTWVEAFFLSLSSSSLGLSFLPLF